MFEDLRNIADAPGTFEEESDAELEALLEQKPKKKTFHFKLIDNHFLGMTAFQRFIISAMLFLLVCVLGTMLLMISSSFIRN